MLENQATDHVAELDDGRYRILLGDCLERLRELEADSVDAIVTDPPAGIAFMGASWDNPKELEQGPAAPARNPRCRTCGGRRRYVARSSVCACDLPDWHAPDARHADREAFVEWLAAVMREAARVLKPGGHALVWALPRTSHWTALALEEAGFELRDRVGYLFGSGFPKSTDVSKAIDKAAGLERTERLGPKPGHATTLGRDNLSALRESGALSGPGGFSRPWMSDPAAVERSHYEYAPASDLAARWSGWGTALKPACEDWWLCRKPLEAASVAANVERHGTGALNIEACRVPVLEDGGRPNIRPGNRERDGAAYTGAVDGSLKAGGDRDGTTDRGRWPAHVVHDGSREVLGVFPSTRPGHWPSSRGPGGVSTNGHGGQRELDERTASRTSAAAYFYQVPRDDAGGEAQAFDAARYFYCAKAPTSDREAGLDGLRRIAVTSDAWGNGGRKVSLLVDTVQSPPRVTAVCGARFGNERAWSTWLFGSTPTGDPYLEAIACTTETETSSTTGPRISSSLAHWITSGSTAAARCAPARGGNRAASAGSFSRCLTFTSAWTVSARGVVRAARPTRLEIRLEEKASTHPTVKPLALMRYLVRLITPPGGVVLDPFMGSGSTGKAALLEGARFVGIEREPEYFDVAAARLRHALELEADEAASREAEAARQLALFGPVVE